MGHADTGVFTFHEVLRPLVRALLELVKKAPLSWSMIVPSSSTTCTVTVTLVPGAAAGVVREVILVNSGGSDVIDGFLEEELADADFLKIGKFDYKVMTSQDIEHMVQMFTAVPFACSFVMRNCLR